MKKTSIVLVLLLCMCMTLSVSAAEYVACEYTFDDIYVDDLYMDGWYMSDSKDNFVIEDDVLSYDWNNAGRALRYWEDISDYTVTYDWQPDNVGNESENAYKNALAIRLPADYEDGHDGLKIYEPDNGDADKTSYLGIVGIYFYGYGTTFEVAIHVDDETRQWDVGSQTYKFTLPEGKSFDEFQTVTVKDEGETVTFSVAGVTLGTVTLSGVAEKEVEAFSGEVYRTAVIKDSTGTELLTVENAIVPTVGSFAFLNRGNAGKIDNLKVVEEREEAPATPTPDVTEPPAGTDEPANTPADTTKAPEITSTAESTEKPVDTDSDDSSVIIIAAVVAVCIIIAGIVTAVVIKKRKSK